MSDNHSNYKDKFNVFDFLEFEP